VTGTNIVAFDGGKAFFHGKVLNLVLPSVMIRLNRQPHVTHNRTSRTTAHFTHSHMRRAQQAFRAKGGGSSRLSSFSARFWLVFGVCFQFLAAGVSFWCDPSSLTLLVAIHP
jgi:hypothetical protein